jgi:hypothetical protein
MKILKKLQEVFMSKTKRSPKAVIETFARDYGEVYYEMNTYKSVLKAMSDIDLVDTLLPYTTDRGIDMDGVVDCYVKLSRDDDSELSTAERAQLEAYYLLINTDLGFDV